MLKIGLTGNIATGKSTVSAVLAEHGADVIDADMLSREVMEPGTEVFGSIVAAFGEELLSADGRLDRAALARIVFADAERMRQLEQIVHPAVATLRVQRLRDSEASIAVLEAVKLVETGQHEQCDELWVVTSTLEAQLRRLVEQRGMRETEAKERLAAQPSAGRKLEVADVVLRNDGTLEELREAVVREWNRLTEALPGLQRGAPGGICPTRE